jgi:hypothetical protein
VSGDDTRETIVNELPDDIQHNIQGGGSDREHVTNIVNTALNYPGGLQRLIELVRHFERGSIAMKKVDAIFEEIYPDQST